MQASCWKRHRWEVSAPPVGGEEEKILHRELNRVNTHNCQHLSGSVQQYLCMSWVFFVFLEKRKWIRNPQRDSRRKKKIEKNRKKKKGKKKQKTELSSCQQATLPDLQLRLQGDSWTNVPHCPNPTQRCLLACLCFFGGEGFYGLAQVCYFRALWLLAVKGAHQAGGGIAVLSRPVTMERTSFHCFTGCSAFCLPQVEDHEEKHPMCRFFGCLLVLSWTDLLGIWRLLGKAASSYMSRSITSDISPSLRKVCFGD